jgi:Rod binding domain-containing protein
MPDSITKLGLFADPIGRVAEAKSLRKFNQTEDFDKKINDRSTLDNTNSEAAKQVLNEKAATDFEALLLQQMIQSMWKSVPSEGLLSGSSEEAMYRDMLSEQLAQELAKNQSMGLKDAVLGEMNKKQKM